MGWNAEYPQIQSDMTSCSFPPVASNQNPPACNVSPIDSSRRVRDWLARSHVKPQWNACVSRFHKHQPRRAQGLRSGAWRADRPVATTLRSVAIATSSLISSFARLTSCSISPQVARWVSTTSAGESPVESIRQLTVEDVMLTDLRKLGPLSMPQPWSRTQRCPPIPGCFCCHHQGVCSVEQGVGMSSAVGHC